jgi:hypothetical protein
LQTAPFGVRLSARAARACRVSATCQAQSPSSSRWSGRVFVDIRSDRVRLVPSMRTSRTAVDGGRWRRSKCYDGQRRSIPGGTAAAVCCCRSLKPLNYGDHFYAMDMQAGPWGSLTQVSGSLLVTARPREPTWSLHPAAAPLLTWKSRARGGLPVVMSAVRRRRDGPPRPGGNRGGPEDLDR